MVVCHDAGMSTLRTPGDAVRSVVRRRPHVVLTLAWLLATVLAATVAWWAVSAVGGERGTAGGLVSQAQVERELAAQRSADGQGTGAGSADLPTADPSPESTAGAGGDTSAEPGGAPAPTPAASSGQGTAPAEGATPPATTAAPGPGADRDPASAPPPTTDVARTWDVTGGQVSAVCTGATIALVYATPADGWSVEVDHAGPAELEVEFARVGEDARLRAECVGGTPEITRSGRDGSAGGDDD